MFPSDSRTSARRDHLVAGIDRHVAMGLDFLAVFAGADDRAAVLVREVGLVSLFGHRGDGQRQREEEGKKSCFSHGTLLQIPERSGCGRHATVRMSIPPFFSEL
jgi:hypothetical protein